MNADSAPRPEAGRLRNPQEVAELLGVSPSGLRRLAEIYASERGELPRDPRTRSRMWPERAVDELAAARNLVLGNRVSSIREALAALADGSLEFPPGLPPARPVGADPLHELLDEVGKLRREVDEMRVELKRLRRQAGESRRGSGDGELHELRRRLRYLQTELELREL